ncbi:MAG: hypothetical protein ACXAEE_07795 [Candidatus Thorarchaeota archaeon]|jgi:hypothetical protein
MVKEIIIMQEGGIPLFHYHVSGEKKLDELVSAFLSAFGAMAQEVGQERITVMAFAMNKFVWVEKGNLLFIALVSQHDSEEIYRVILRDLASKFVSQYYSELVKEDVSPGQFNQFVDTVELTLHKFSGIPGLARRYRTAVLPADELSKLKESMDRVEEDARIFRGAFVTEDCHIVLSNLRAYELEDVLDFTELFFMEKEKPKKVTAVTHPGLERNTSFYILRVPDKGVCAYVVKPDETESVLFDAGREFLELVKTIDLNDAKKAKPSRRESPMAFYGYDVAVPTKSTPDILASMRPLFSEMSDKLQFRIRTVLGHVSTDTTISDIHVASGLTRSHIDEALAYLIAQGAIQIMRLYPILGKKDDRFAAYLEVVGIPKRDYKVLDAIWNHCNGRLSVKDISKESGIPVPRMIDVLRTLGSQVKWNRKPGG